MGTKLRGKAVPILSMGRVTPTRIIPGSAAAVAVAVSDTTAAGFATGVLAGPGHQ
ncbi:hypothetical protein [Rhodanobacter spathiphylli]|uniref:hypothetical protein n=1 Tax=Rhodanobacter spathiphylli TaxID=347483 RepID=UPI0012F927E5|nr:hypothetical protein [Rhodanobacter spathiphylli]